MQRRQWYGHREAGESVLLWLVFWKKLALSLSWAVPQSLHTGTVRWHGCPSPCSRRSPATVTLSLGGTAALLSSLQGFRLLLQTSRRADLCLVLGRETPCTRFPTTQNLYFFLFSSTDWMESILSPEPTMSLWSQREGGGREGRGTEAKGRWGRTTRFPGAFLSEWMRVEGSGCPQDFTGLGKGALLAWIKGDAGSYMGVGLGHACRHEYTCTQTQTHIHTRAFSLLGVLKCQSEAADLSCQYPGDNSHLLDTRMNYCQLLPCAPQPGGPCLSRPQYSWPFHRPLWVSPKPPSPQVEHIKQSLVRGRGGGNLSHTNIQDFPRWQWKFLTESKVPITRRKCSQCSKFFKKQFPKQYYNPIFLNIPTSVISYVSLELQSPGWSSSLHPH